MELRHIEDYLEPLKETYPEVSEEDLKKILKHGFMSFYALNNMGADLMIGAPKMKDFLLYVGWLIVDKEGWNKYYFKRKAIKIKLEYYHESKHVWDGNYYFGIKEDQFKQLNWEKKGRLKKKVVFTNVILNKPEKIPYLHECYKYFFKVTGEPDQGLSKLYERLETRNVSLIAIRDADGKIKKVDG